MDAALKKSVITLNSQFRNYVEDPNSCDFITIPGFLKGLYANTAIGPQTGRPLFYGVEQISLLDATFVEHANNSPVSTEIAIDFVVGALTIDAADTTNFPNSGLISIRPTGEQIWYNSITHGIPGQFLNCIRGYNGTTEQNGPAPGPIDLMGEPYIYLRLSEPSLGPLEAVEMSTEINHYNRFFAKIPIDNSKVDVQQYFNHDGKWSTWSNWINFSQPFPYIEKLRMQTFRFYGNDMKPWPNPDDPMTRSLPINVTLRINAHENKMWENRGLIVDASENESESSGEEEDFF